MIASLRTHRTALVALVCLLGIINGSCFAQQAPALPAQAGTPPSGITVPAKDGVEMSGTINGHGPFPIFFDSGSGNLISQHLAKRIGLNIEAPIVINTEDSTVAAQTAHVDSVKVGAMTMSSQWFAVIDPPFAKDQDFAVVGDQLLQNLAVKVDFEHQQITFYNERNFIYSGDAVPIPAQLQQGAVYAEASVDGISGLFGIDMGYKGSLAFNALVVIQDGLVQRYGARIRGYSREGWGRPDLGFYTRAGGLLLGNVIVRQPVTVLLTNNQGAAASTRIAGNIGLHILRQFTILFDCPHGVLYMEPNSSFGKPDIFNRAGLILASNSGQFEIESIVPGSPAETAHLAPGDVISKINGSEPTDASLHGAFTQPVGTSVQVTVDHAGKSCSVSLVLKDVL